MRKIKVREAIAKYEAPKNLPKIIEISSRMTPIKTIPGAEHMNLYLLLAAIIFVSTSFVLPVLEIPDREEYQYQKSQDSYEPDEAHHLFLDHEHIHNLGDK